MQTKSIAALLMCLTLMLSTVPAGTEADNHGEEGNADGSEDLPDLAVTKITLQYEQFLSITVENLGGGDVSMWDYNQGMTWIYIDDVQNNPVWTYSWTTLYDHSFADAGGSSILMPQAIVGQHTIYACVDATYRVNESNEGNNCLRATVTGQDPDASDDGGNGSSARSSHTSTGMERLSAFPSDVMGQPSSFMMYHNADHWVTTVAEDLMTQSDYSISWAVSYHRSVPTNYVLTGQINITTGDTMTSQTDLTDMAELNNGCYDYVASLYDSAGNWLDSTNFSFTMDFVFEDCDPIEPPLLDLGTPVGGCEGTTIGVWVGDGDWYSPQPPIDPPQPPTDDNDTIITVIKNIVWRPASDFKLDANSDGTTNASEVESFNEKLNEKAFSDDEGTSGRFSGMVAPSFEINGGDASKVALVDLSLRGICPDSHDKDLKYMITIRVVYDSLSIIPHIGAPGDPELDPSECTDGDISSPDEPKIGAPDDSKVKDHYDDAGNATLLFSVTGLRTDWDATSTDFLGNGTVPLDNVMIDIRIGLDGYIATYVAEDAGADKSPTMTPSSMTQWRSEAAYTDVDSTMYVLLTNLNHEDAEACVESGDSKPKEDGKDESDDIPGFTMILSLTSMLGAAIVFGRRRF
jgi:hypothetical protein